MMALRMRVFLVLVLLGLGSSLVCPDGGLCGDEETCCKNTEEGYGCCPLPHAECCSDHLHCCYEGTVCDLVHQKCVNKTVSLPWMKRLTARPAPLLPQVQLGVRAVMCPDESECPDDTTCCQLPDGSWGCCPLSKAVCCEDKRHCCPEGTKCDLVHSKCVSSSLESFPLLEKLPARRRANKPAVSVICPGGKSSCTDDSTCCLLSGGDYGCCPYPKATCCSDQLHCCPSNTVCDLDHGVCRSAENQVPLMKKIPAGSNDVVCPDQKSACPDQTTCCQMSNETYGCCPLPNAVCCSDHVHCCPTNTKCDLKHDVCVPDWGHAPSLVKVLSAVTAPAAAQGAVGAVPCNESVACADGNTCCKSARGQWACCPLPEAVCCEDHLHCCPHGTVCNLAASTCDHSSGGAVTPLLPNTPVFPLMSENRKCDETTSCPGNATCCKAVGAGWGCCPLPQAVCCDDHLHCCPHGSICNLEAETCDDRSGLSLPWFSKVPALASGGPKSRDPSVPLVQKTEPVWVVSGRVQCDSQTSCPKDTTCCFMERSQRWGCCPIPDAVCCKDGNHCCPRGHTCDPRRSSCSRGPHVIAWFSKQSARTEPSRVTDVKCDDTSSCASGTTCCQLQSGEWGCCPLVKAVCCADHEHCCPQGYTCNMKTGTCEKKAVAALPLSGAVRSEDDEDAVRSEDDEDAVRSEDDEDVSCDGSEAFRCSRQETCCRISDTEWSCCPAQKAVCCGDSKHCCPVGFSCDLQAGGCTQQNHQNQLTWDSLWRDRKPGL